MGMHELAWMLIGACAAMIFVLGMLFFHHGTRRRWLKELLRDQEATDA